MGTETVAIIDDDPSVRAFLEAALREQDYQVMSFATAEAYLASPRARAPSCLIVDLQLPGMDGEQLFRALRDDDRSIPVIFMSGYGTVSIATRLMKEGAVYFLEKPVRLQELERLVDRHLGPSELGVDDAQAVDGLLRLVLLTGQQPRARLRRHLVADAVELRLLLAQAGDQPAPGSNDVSGNTLGTIRTD